MRTKLLSLILAGLLLLPLTACNTVPSETDESDTPETVETTDKIDEPTDETDPPEETDPVKVIPTDDSPLGTGIGVHPGRVTWAYNENAYNWDGKAGFWWLEKNYDVDIVKTMLEDCISQLAGEDDVNKALDALIKNYNKRRTGEAKGYTKGEKIFIKANMNATGNANAEELNILKYYPAPVTMRALLEILVDFGITPDDITIGDPSRNFPTYVEDMLTQGNLKGVNILGYNLKENKADTTKPITWSHDFDSDNWPDYGGYDTTSPTFWPCYVTEATYMINLFNLRGHNLAGFTASGKNHFGTVMPAHEVSDGVYEFPYPFRVNPPSFAGLHHYVASADMRVNPPELWHLDKREMGTYNVLVDLLSNADAGGKTILYLCDALASTVHQSSSMSANEKWLSAPFGDGTRAGAGWTNSFLASQDPIAIDSVCYDFLLAEQDANEAIGDNKWNVVLPEGNTAENYLIEAALAHNPPSGTLYQDGYGNPVGSLGVHEHWNNPTEKLYSRNLGENEGIELIQIRY